ncbi:MAG TPA: hypothetical protein VFW62_02625 [bacterium]|nr:hypothetical protein [bacterium]
MKAAESAQKRLEKQAEKEAAEEYAAGVGSSDMFDDPELAERAVRAGKSPSPYLRKEGRGGRRGGGGSGGGGSGGGGGLRQRLGMADPADEVDTSSVAGKKIFSRETIDKHLAKLNSDIMDLTDQIGAPGVDQKAVSKRQLYLIKQRRELLKMRDENGNIEKQLEKARQLVGEEEFASGLSVLRDSFDQEIEPILRQDGYGEDYIANAKKDFIGTGIKNLPYDGAALLDTAKIKRDLADDIEANESDREEFFSVLRSADARTLQAMAKDPNADAYEKHYATKALMTRKLFDGIEAVTGKFISTFSPAETAPEVKQSVRRVFQEIFDVRPNTASKLRRRVSKPAAPEATE